MVEKHIHIFIIYVLQYSTVPGGGFKGGGHWAGAMPPPGALREGPEGGHFLAILLPK